MASIYISVQPAVKAFDETKELVVTHVKSIHADTDNKKNSVLYALRNSNVNGVILRARERELTAEEQIL